MIFDFRGSAEGREPQTPYFTIAETMAALAAKISAAMRLELTACRLVERFAKIRTSTAGQSGTFLALFNVPMCIGPARARQSLAPLRRGVFFRGFLTSRQAPRACTRDAKQPHWIEEVVN